MRRLAKWISSFTMCLSLVCLALPAARAQDNDNGQSLYGDSTVEAHPADSGDQSTTDGEDTVSNGKPEVIKERYSSGEVKIEREVAQDAGDNYLNHGAWKMFNERGGLVAQGQYDYGQRVGTWVRWYRSPSEAPLLTRAPYQQFTAPFISQGTFENDKLNGEWTIYDGKKRKISQWQFVNGKRHGMSLWWHANGRKMREITFRDGDIDGNLIEWSPEGAVTLKETYQAGRKLAEKSSKHADGSKKSQGMYLFAKDVEKTPDDWWNCKLVTSTATGTDEKHGPWVSWHSNGKHQLEGAYEHDLQVGLFTWWHANGQKALEGRFEADKQDGAWTWWYANGQKSIQGGYVKGNPTGRWTWWQEDGKVVQAADLSKSEGIVIQQTPGRMPNMLPQARQPSSRQPVRR